MVISAPNSDLDAPGIPVIDISGLFEGSSERTAMVARQIGQACRGIGFFYITGHGISEQAMQTVFRAAENFFASPPALKLASRFIGATGNRGYVGIGGESLSPGQLPDIKEVFNIGLDLLPDDPDILARKPFRTTNLWPDVPGFRAVMLDYFDQMLGLAKALHRAFAVDLDIDPNFFDDKFRKPMATLRLLHYPPFTPQPGVDQKGAGEHTDYGNVTLLATDAVGGLMVRDRGGRWLEAPVMPGAFVCNIGDCLMRWTNDVYTSTPHKVETPPGQERYSVAFFVDPDPEALVVCLPTCLPAGETPKYPPVTAGDHIKSRLEPTYAQTAAKM